MEHDERQMKSCQRDCGGRNITLRRIQKHPNGLMEMNSLIFFRSISHLPSGCGWGCSFGNNEQTSSCRLAEEKHKRIFSEKFRNIVSLVRARIHEWFSKENLRLPSHLNDVFVSKSLLEVCQSLFDAKLPVTQD